MSSAQPADRLRTNVGRVALKNPVIAASAEHLIDADGVRRALRAGAGAVVLKSTNETQAARDQLQRAEYMVLDENWRPLPWDASVPRHSFVACRSGLHPLRFDAWLEEAATLDREARDYDSYAVASLILAELDPAITMARQIEQAGLRVLELNIGTPYASQAGKSVVATELDPQRVSEIVTAVRGAVAIPLWVKITGQSERVPELAEAAFAAGGEVVVMAGRSLGLLPDLETFEPMLGTSLGVGGNWNLPLTCHWLALSRARLGRDRPLIGTNGAQSGEDVARMLLAGAHAVEMASAIMLRGEAVIDASVETLASYLASKSLSVPELIGRAADRRRTFAQMPMLQDNWRNYVTRSEPTSRTSAGARS